MTSFKGLKKGAVALGLAFMAAAAPLTGYNPAHAARNTEPYSCQINGRVYNPQSASVTVDTVRGTILSGEHIDELRHPASMTKMMTLVLIFDALRDGRLSLSDEVTVHLSDDIRQTRANSRSTWLAEGTKLTVEEAILAIAVASANNVSVLMAELLAGSEQDFVQLMNDKAQSIGMRRTVFTNSSGLPDKDQVSTARDIAKLALYLGHEYPQYSHYFSAPVAEFGSWRGARAKHNHNELAIDHDYIDGMKTGFICDSGYNIAVTAQRGNHRVITIVFGGRTPHQRNEHAQALIDNALQDILLRQAEEKAGGTGYANAPAIHDDTRANFAQNDDNHNSDTPALTVIR